MAFTGAFALYSNDVESLGSSPTMAYDETKNCEGPMAQIAELWRLQSW